MSYPKGAPRTTIDMSGAQSEAVPAALPGEQRVKEAARERAAPAKNQERRNRLAEIESEIANVARMKSYDGRGSKRAVRDGYDRAYARLERRATDFATAFGESVTIPEYDPPPLPDEGGSRTIAPGVAPTGRYQETQGMKSGHGKPRPSGAIEGSMVLTAGSQADTAWAEK